jgi:hypothetical protein
VAYGLESGRRQTLRHKDHEGHKDHREKNQVFVVFVFFVIFVPERTPFGRL